MHLYAVLWGIVDTDVLAQSVTYDKYDK